MNLFKNKRENEKNYRELKYEVLKKFLGISEREYYDDEHSHKHILSVLRNGRATSHEEINKLKSTISELRDELFEVRTKKDMYYSDLISMQEIINRKDFIIQKLKDKK